MAVDLQYTFKEFCKKNKFELNNKQLEIVKNLEKFFYPKNKIINFFLKNKKKCFYLYGNVGVGKTMIANHVYDKLDIKKTKFHFNEFMINFHDFRHTKKDDNRISEFVINLKKKSDLIYLDEFQVTNIVDAMILGKLFEIIFLKNIKILITSNTNLVDLYKEGLQREQFIPFINLIKKQSIHKELFLEEDYRTHNKDNNQRIFYPLNEKTLFRINQNFRILTKNLKREQKTINTKGRMMKINDYYDGLARFNFKELCDQNLGAEDYLKINESSYFIIIENIPKFNDINSNQQQRFIILIDVIYDKNKAIAVTADQSLEKLTSSKSLEKPFKRTISRLFELTSRDFQT